MADTHSPEVRSYNMSRIRSKNTRPEIIVRKFLFSHGFRYRLHNTKLPGKPDLVLKKLRAVVFVHGCFWHSHIGCRFFVIPKTRTEWWRGKLKKNAQRDFDNACKLKKAGWRVIVVWTCLLGKDKKDRTLNKLLLKLKNLD